MIRVPILKRGSRFWEGRVKSITTRTRSGARRSTSPAAPDSNTATGGSSTICIVVADGAAIDRAAIGSLIRAQDDFLVVGEASNTQEAIETCRRLQPEVLVLTLTLPSPLGEPALAEIRTALPDLPVVAMSERGWSECLILNPPTGAHGRNEPANPGLCGGGNDCLQVAAAQGAAGTVRRSADPKALFETIRAVASGRSSYEPGTMAALNGAAEDAAESPLSPRLIEVSHLLAEGRSNKEIARSLEISPNTVKTHIANLFEKLEVQRRTQAIQKARELSIVP